MEENKTREEMTAPEEEQVELKLELGDPFRFDGQDYKTLDLSGLFDLTAMDMAEIDRRMQAMGYSYARPEVTGVYAMLVAAKINHKPWEFCQGMKARDMIRLRETVRAFFYAQG